MLMLLLSSMIGTGLAHQAMRSGSGRRFPRRQFSQQSVSTRQAACRHAGV